MNVSAPKFSWGLNFNTILVLASLGAVLIGWGVTWGQTSKDVESAIDRDAAQDILIQSNSQAVNKIPNFEYRLTQQERGATSLSRSVEELKQAVNSQSSDLRVIREIVSRMDQQRE